MDIHGDSPMVSVWIVTYNHEPFIRMCLESVMMQKTNFAFEVIIGEDYSTDNTRKIVEEFAERYPQQIKPILHAQNVGANSNAYEYCYPRLRGRYIACLEADDYWIDEFKLQAQVDALEADQNAVLCFTAVNELISAQDTFRTHWSTVYNTKKRYSVTDILKKFNIVTCSLLFRNIYPDLPYNPADFPTGDVSLCVFLLLKGYGIYLDKITAVYRIHDSGIYSPQSFEKKNLVFVKLLQQFLKQPALSKHKQLIKKLLSDRAYQAFCFEIKKNDPDKENMALYYQTAMKYFNYYNIFYPLKTLLRKNIFYLTGKSFGRNL